MAAPDWKGLFEWSMKHNDGTTPAAEMKQMKPEDRAWFEQAMQQYTVEVAQRLTAIKQTLDARPDAGGDAPEELLAHKEALLEELLEIVENLDHARDLTKVGGLETLLALLEAHEAGLRWRAAEVAGACVQLNPPVQAWFLQGGALPPLLRLWGDADAACRQKGLLAVSCLVRNNPEGLQAFLAAGGPDSLAALTSDPAPRVQRKALQLLAEVAREAPGALQPGQLLPALRRLEGSQDADLREAAAGAAAALAAAPPAGAGGQRTGDAGSGAAEARGEQRAPPLLLGGPGSP